MGESLPNQEIFRRLSRAMGFEENYLYEDDQSVIDKTLKYADLGVDWETLKEKGWVSLGDEPVVLWSEGNVPDTIGQDRDRERTGGSRRPSARSPADGRSASGRRPLPPAVAGRQMADEFQLRQRPACRRTDG